MTIIGDATIAVDSDTSKFAKDVEDKTSAVAKKAAALFAAGFSARAVVDFARDSIGAASDLNETVSKTQVVFGQAAGSVLKFGETSAQAIGASKQEALGAAATFGNLLRSVGLTDEQAAKFSVNMTQLAGDLASFNNVPVPEALDAIRAGLVGETEPLKRFGVNLNDATLKQKALELGLADGKGVLDANAKAQAAYSLIMEQTTLAQGDFARTSGGLANQQRILAAEFDNVKASIGQQLLPTAIELVHVFRDALPQFQELASSALPGLVSSARAFVPVGQSFLSVLVALAPLLEVAADVITSIPAPLLTMATTMALLGSGMGPLPNIFKQFNAGMKDAGGGLGGLKAGFLGLNPVMIGASIALPILSNAMAQNSAETRRQKAALDETTKAFLDQATAIGEDVIAMAKVQLEQKNQVDDLARLNVTFAEFAKSARGGDEAQRAFIQRMIDSGEASLNLSANLDIQRLGITTLSGVIDHFGSIQRAVNSSVLTGNTGLIRSLLELEKRYNDAAKAALDQLTASEDLTQKQVDEASARHRLADGTTDYLGVLRQLRPDQAKVVEGTQNATKAIDVQTDSLEVQQKQLEQTTDALNDYLGSQLTAQDRAVEWEAALDDLTEGIKENGLSLDVTTEKGRDNITNLRSIRESIIKATEARYLETKSADEAAATTEYMIQRLKDELRQRGFSQKAIDDYVAALKLTPSDVRTNLIVNADEAAGKLTGFATLVKVIGQRSADAFVQGFTQGLRDGEGRLVTSADSAAHRIETAVRARLRQQSPSKVGVDIGRNFAESIGLGIDEGSSTSTEAVERLGKFMEETIYRAAMVTQEEEAAILRAHKAIIDSQERLNEVRKDAKHSAEDLRLAELEVSLAQQEYNRVVDDSTSATGALADAQEALEAIAGRVREQVASVFGALSAGFASGDAARALTDAKRDLAALRLEQTRLPGQIAAAEKKLADARTEAARTTATEALAIVRARQQVADAQARVAAASAPPGTTTAEALAIVQAKQAVATAEKRLADEQAKAAPDALAVEEATLRLTVAQEDLKAVTAAAVAPAGDLREAQLELTVAQQRLSEAQADAVAPTRAVADAERALTELREAAATIAERVRDATQAVTEAQIRQIEATQRLRDAQAELIGQGPAALQHFRDMAAAAGLSRREIDALVDSLRRMNDSGGATTPPGSRNPITRPITGPKQPVARSGTVAEELQRLANKSPNSIIIGENGQRVIFQPGAVQVGVMDTSLVMTKLNVTAAVSKAVKTSARLTPAGR